MPDFQNDPILEHDLPRFEDIELRSVSRKYLQVVFLNIAVFSVILLTAAGVGYYFLRGYLGESAWALPGGVVLLMVFNAAYQYAAFFQRKYAIREKDLIYQFGLMRRNIIIIPFNRIQHTALEEGWLSRSLGLKSVSVFTAGAGGSDLTVNGLPKEVAENFNQLILTKIDEEKMDDDNTLPLERTAQPASHAAAEVEPSKPPAADEE